MYFHFQHDISQHTRLKKSLFLSHAFQTFHLEGKTSKLITNLVYYQKKHVYYNMQFFTNCTFETYVANASAKWVRFMESFYLYLYNYLLSCTPVPLNSIMNVQNPTFYSLLFFIRNQTLLVQVISAASIQMVPWSQLGCIKAHW